MSIHLLHKKISIRGGSWLAADGGRAGVLITMKRVVCCVWVYVVCLRGDACPYEHGADRIVVDEALLNQGFGLPDGGPIDVWGFG
jgi:hypothetical protein